MSEDDEWKDRDIEGKGDHSVEEAFFADSFSILFTGGKFLLDLKHTVPIVEHEDGEHKQLEKTNHNPIVMDPVLAKKLFEFMGKNIEKYEDRFGEITVEEEEEETEETEKKDHVSYIS
ncbi:MAG: DUF3467 domain-containing protein [Candidatus Aenigmatarchaeota archaeon]